jgi:type III secretion system FlhB-like substrate exporter
VLGFDRSFLTLDTTETITQAMADSEVGRRIPNALAYPMIAAVNGWLNRYKAEHDNAPYLDENDKEIKMGMASIY